MTLYFFSGLGADKRAFQNLMLPGHWVIKHVEWIGNLKNESLQDYCKRLSAYIDISKPFSFVGLSFGGIVAVELARILKPEKIIIISSVSTKKELPMDLVGNILLRKLKLFKLIPSSAFKKVNSITHWLFGTKTKDEKQLLEQIIKDTPPKFAKWAMGNILTWNNETRPTNLTHIHGTADRIFPVKKTLADIKIDGGGHFMIYNKAEMISKILAEIL